MRAPFGRRARARFATVATALALAAPLTTHVAVLPAVADATVSVDDRSVAVPTGWRYYSGVTTSYVSGTVLSGGYRLTEVKADQPTNPSTWSVRAVPNSGAYAVSAWWWYVNVTTAQVSSLLSTNHARLISVDGYNTSSGARFAVVMVNNLSPATKSWHWYFSSSPTTIHNNVVANGDRIIDISDFMVGATHYYTAVTVKNTAPDNKGWYWYTNRTTAQVSSLLSTNHARLVDLEATGSGTWDVVMTTDTPGFWVWYVGMGSASRMVQVANQTGTRLISIQRYTSGSSTLFAGVFLNNLAAPSSTMRDLEYAQLGINTWGFYSRRVGGSTITALQATTPFEPASAIKAMHHLYVHMRLQNASVTTADSIAYPYRASDPTNKDICPSTSDPLKTTNLGNADQQMMQVSDNRMTRAIKDKYGYGNILAVANILGMSQTSFPNTLGCLTYGAYNLTSLNDLGKLYASVAAGNTLNGSTRAHFYSSMLNFTNYSPAKTFFCNVATTEGNSLGKTAQTITDFCNAMEWAAKGGSYTLNLSDGRHIWRSNFGRLALPVKSGAVISLAEYVYGDFIHDVKADSAKETAINNARSAATAEQFRAQIRAALATW